MRTATDLTEMKPSHAKPGNRTALWRQIQQQEPALAALLKECAQVCGRPLGLRYEVKADPDAQLPDDPDLGADK